MRFASGQQEGKEAPFSICECVNLRVAPSTRAANSLLLLPLFRPLPSDALSHALSRSSACLWIVRSRQVLGIGAPTRHAATQASQCPHFARSKKQLSKPRSSGLSCVTAFGVVRASRSKGDAGNLRDRLCRWHVRAPRIHRREHNTLSHAWRRAAVDDGTKRRRTLDRARPARATIPCRVLSSPRDAL